MNAEPSQTAQFKHTDGFQTGSDQKARETPQFMASASSTVQNNTAD